MRKATMLLAMVTLVIWLARGAPAPDERRFSTNLVVPRAAAPALPEDPCGGCDPNQEADCYMQGGIWDSTNCTCDTSCDPSGIGESNCYASGGIWDPFSCSCQPAPCNPGPPQETEIDSGYYQDCEYGELVDHWWHVYLEEEYCQDGTLYDSWTQTSDVSSPTGDPCGDPCEIDPSLCDPCYGDPYCYCYYDYCS